MRSPPNRTSVLRRRIAGPLSSGKHPPGYWKEYYRRNKPRIVRTIVESRRRRRAELRAHLEAVGLWPLPPEYREHVRQQQRVARFIRRLHALEDLPEKPEERQDAG